MFHIRLKLLSRSVPSNQKPWIVIFEIYIDNFQLDATLVRLWCVCSAESGIQTRCLAWLTTESSVPSSGMGLNEKQKLRFLIACSRGSWSYLRSSNPMSSAITLRRQVGRHFMSNCSPQHWRFCSEVQRSRLPTYQILRTDCSSNQDLWAV